MSKTEFVSTFWTSGLLLMCVAAYAGGRFVAWLKQRRARLETERDCERPDHVWSGDRIKCRYCTTDACCTGACLNGHG